MQTQKIKLSANLGFLWQEHDLIDGIRAASSAGFVAVECHWPYEYASQDVLDVLTETGLPMVGLNTYPGNKEQGDFGLCTDSRKIKEAHQLIDQAIEYASLINTPNVHVMAGRVGDSDDQDLAMKTFQDNLIYAAKKAEQHGITVLIEPINKFDVVDYFVSDLDIAVGILNRLNLPNLKLMFDCYHIQKVHGEIKNRLEQHLDLIGHIQIASSPNRQEPDQGEVDYADLFSFIAGLGYEGYIGAEYHPRTTTDEGLGWMRLID